MNTRFGHIEIIVNADTTTIKYNDFEYSIPLNTWNKFKLMHPLRTEEALI